MNPIDEDFVLGNVSPDKNVLPEKKSLALAPQINSPARELVLLDCGDFSLFVPSHEVVSLVSSQQLVTQPQSSCDCGYLEFMQQYYSIFCFNKTLQLQSTITAAHSAVVLFNEQNILFGICCHELVKQNTTAQKFHSVPTSMRSRKQPFTEFTIVNNRAVGVSSAAALMALLRLRGARLVAHESVTTTLQGAG